MTHGTEEQRGRKRIGEGGKKGKRRKTAEGLTFSFLFRGVLFSQLVTGIQHALFGGGWLLEAGGNSASPPENATECCCFFRIDDRCPERQELFARIGGGAGAFSCEWAFLSLWVHMNEYGWFIRGYLSSHHFTSLLFEL
eukprot:TRINITY_DN3099_c0_g1_i1.p1 TRINITY_DN3099_c0_g1~~TRINITY_DN3099_c0_g1_i1.p1  ORF type:complete len:139 (+),score=7.24 TRINITY_DN3099_c0_g1_i1:208-624(+)